MRSAFLTQRLVVAGAVLIATGCYALQPVVGQPLPLGAVVSLSINDAGRSVLSGTMGPEISDIQGRLVHRDSAEWVLAVEQVSLLRGGEQVWSGERIRVKTEFVNAVSEKHFSRSRTVIVSAAVVGVVGLLISQGILGNIAGDDGKLPPDTGVSIKYPRFIKR